MLAKGVVYDKEFSNDRSHEGCIQPAALEWEGKGLRMMTSCEDGSRRVCRADGKGESVDGGIRHFFRRVGQLTDTYRARRAGWLRQRDDRWTESHPRQPAGIIWEGGRRRNGSASLVADGHAVNS
ncbi:putative trans-sialidase [Trypanosoma cruzi]|nr:putative trans-sialidase [Trypanosoma cruzi]